MWQGGAGTWSDGKLVTRIGKNSDGVQAVRKTTLLKHMNHEWYHNFLSKIMHYS